MDRRLELHDLLLKHCAHVYFQPPATVKLSYPCIVYSLSRIDPTFANDKPYTLSNRYQLTYICRDPDDDMKMKLAALPMCRFDRFYTADNLNHYTYSIYY